LRWRATQDYVGVEGVVTSNRGQRTRKGWPPLAHGCDRRARSRGGSRRSRRIQRNGQRRAMGEARSANKGGKKGGGLERARLLAGTGVGVSCMASEGSGVVGTCEVQHPSGIHTKKQNYIDVKNLTEQSIGKRLILVEMKLRSEGEDRGGRARGIPMWEIKV